MCYHWVSGLLGCPPGRREREGTGLTASEVLDADACTCAPASMPFRDAVFYTMLASVALHSVRRWRDNRIKQIQSGEATASSLPN